jgi:hypothetical protein
MTFAEIKRRFFKPAKPDPVVVDLEAERRKRWLAKHARPMPPKTPPEAA